MFSDIDSGKIKVCLLLFFFYIFKSISHHPVHYPAFINLDIGADYNDLNNDRQERQLFDIVCHHSSADCINRTYFVVVTCSSECVIDT